MDALLTSTLLVALAEIGDNGQPACPLLRRLTCAAS
jgi:putative Ca2+/H+ antiporter (TMEM165/GDT1 family)